MHMDEFLTAAIIGTAQYKNALPITHSAVDTLANQLSSEQKERAFLLAAGARAIYLQAGKQVVIAAEPPAPAAPETRQACSEQVANLLIDLFMASNSVLLSEALQRLNAAQLRVPHAILPHCLTYATQHKESRAGLIAVVGERGRWLSQFNATWNWINDELLAKNGELPADAEIIWQEGTLEQRQEILQRLRARDPEKARAWLQAVWQDEKAETRTIFIACLQAGISSDDQTFIEQALEDRSEGVRQIAVSLLHFMPAAPQMQAMLNVISGMIDYKKTLLRRQFSIKLPEQVDLAWKNTISIIKLKQDNHDAEYWLQHAFSRISPQYWEEHFSSPPEELVDAIDKTPLGKALLHDIMKAALLHNATNWYAPLIEWYIQYILSHSNQPMDNVCNQMLITLSPQKRETLIAPLQTKPEYGEKAIHLLPAPWSITFSRDCINMLEDYSRQDDAANYTFWSNVLPTIAQALHPSCFELTQELWNPTLDHTASWQIQQKRRQITEFIALLHLRTRILEEIY